MILTKEVEIKPSGKSIQYYRDKGYDAKWRESLIVRVEDLPYGTSTKVEVLCDFCEKEKRKISYRDYNQSIDKYGKYACNKCAYKKGQMTSLEKYGENCYSKTEECKIQRKQECLKKYGTEAYFQTEDFKEKRRRHNLETYGVDNYAKTRECHEKMELTMERIYGVKHPLQSDEIKNSIIESWIDKYGYDNPSKSPEVKEKIRSSFIEKYGYTNPMKSPEVREKMRNTCISCYGVEYVSQSPEVRAKVAQSFYQNGTTPTSKQQRYIFNLYKSVNSETELNYPISYYSADICFPEEKIDLEYDGGFHDGMVQTGKLTQEEFDRKELIRDRVIKSEGYKLIRIKTNLDKLPSDPTLLQMLQDARNYFSEYPNHSWIEFNLDTSTVRNAEHKGGIPYDFGSLRTIKDKDIQNIENQTNKKGA